MEDFIFATSRLWDSGFRGLVVWGFRVYGGLYPLVLSPTIALI